MKKELLSQAVILLVSGLLSSCQKTDSLSQTEEYSPESVILEEQYYEKTEGQTVLGDVIDIPYSIENLLTAYNNLSTSTKSQIDVEDIKPTHYYVRFYPKSIEELDILRNIKPYVFLSEIPLDRKIVIGGSSYHDPSIPEDLPTYQYTVIPVERWESLQADVPVEMEILIKAFIPDYDEAYTTKSAAAFGIPTGAYESLLKEAYRITGNAYDKLPQTKVSWNPSGRIRAYDDDFGTMVAVPGVRIRATHLLNVKETLTNEYGYFSLPSFSNPVNMRIIWESDDWDIRNGDVGQATYDGPQIYTSSWQCNIGADEKEDVRFATIQRATYRYFYGGIAGLQRPVFSNKLKICQINESNSNTGVFTNVLGWHIRLWTKKQNDEYRGIKFMYYNTLHELSHAAHYSNNQSDFNSYSQAIKESWADFAALMIYEEEYGQYSNMELYVRENNWPYFDDKEYSPIFLDLKDDYNQQTAAAPGYVLPTDTVSGYTNAQLCGILNNQTYTISILKARVKAEKPAGVTDAQIDALFIQYEHVLANH